MKIIKAERFSSFYESFSDLIFGTMAIFILLMIVLLTQVKQENIEAIKKANEETNKQLQKSAEINEELQSVIEKMAQEIDAIKFKKLEILVTVDTTGSMAEAIKSLHETMSTLSAILSKTSPDFKAAVISYGENPALIEFPLTRILPEQKDNGNSLKNLTQFFDSLAPMTEKRGGSAPVRIALTRAVTVLNHKIASDDALQIILLVGDVGPFEGIAPNQWDAEAITTSEVLSTWLRGDKKRRILTVFANKSTENSNTAALSWLNSQIMLAMQNIQDEYLKQCFASLSNYVQQEIQHKKQIIDQARNSPPDKHELFFMNLANLNNQTNGYTNNEGKILSMILDAIIKGK